ncbi:50S ribosomal protein L3 [bacterium BMS3Bbin03]|nr:50S ribosomal protein L3 [bacterium BMS3Bbin03]HDL78520.1 50S ribosomal protein L3 [Bacteroidota bacterium]HDZ12427.1 50S ribosomal protein L3 [Bacteroidota bacterium]
MVGLIGKKIGMTRIFDENGKHVVVTVIEAGPCYVTQIKTNEIDGYSAVQLGFRDKKEKRATGPEIGHTRKANLKPFYVLKEFRDFDHSENFKSGDRLDVSLFSPGERVNIASKSKGRGFQGVVKRHGFKGGPVTHGQSDRLRAPGSIGQSSYPSRVMKGTRMGGRMGNDRVTVKNLRVVRVYPDQNIILIRGAVPGSMNSTVEIRK